MSFCIKLFTCTYIQAFVQPTLSENLMRQVGALSIYGEHEVKRTIWHLTEFTVWSERQTSEAIIVVQRNELPNIVNPVKVDITGEDL